MSEVDVVAPGFAVGTGDETLLKRDVSLDMPTFTSLLPRAAALRDQAEITHADIEDLHHDTQIATLDEQTDRFARQQPQDILESLSADVGLSWATIARMVGVSGTAVRKWRRGEPVTAENRRSIARAMALISMIGQYPIHDPASWLEMRISDDSSLTPLDLYDAKRVNLLLDHAARRQGPAAILESFDPDWRTKYPSDERFAVVIAPDGHRAIVERRD